MGALSKLDDPEDLKIRTPVQIQQGTADQTVFKLFTDPLVDEYKKRGIKVTYKTYEGVTTAAPSTTPARRPTRRSTSARACADGARLRARER